jgi:hypothetical protein
VHLIDATFPVALAPDYLVGKEIPFQNQMVENLSAEPPKLARALQ